MAISRNQVIAVLPHILTQEMRRVISSGIEAGLELFDSLDEQNKAELEEFASNASNRILFSSMCAKLKQAISQADCGLQACACKKTSTTYIEITAPDLIMHLRNDASSQPQYVQDALANNCAFALGKTNYVQLAYKAENGKILEEVSFRVMDENGKTIYREIIDGSWNKEGLTA